MKTLDQSIRDDVALLRRLTTPSRLHRARAYMRKLRRQTPPESGLVVRRDNAGDVWYVTQTHERAWANAEKVRRASTEAKMKVRSDGSYESKDGKVISKDEVIKMGRTAQRSESIAPKTEKKKLDLQEGQSSGPIQLNG